MDDKDGKSGRKSQTPEEAGFLTAPPDPAVFATNMVHVASQSQKLLREFLSRQAENHETPQLDPLNLSGALTELLTRILSDPQRLVEAQLNLWRDYASLWHQTARRILGEKVEPMIKPAPGDKRFRYSDWEENEVFDFIKQSYLLTTRWLQSTVADIDGLDKKTRAKLDFYTKQFADAIAPTNFLLTNPEVLRATLAENGENLVRGLSNVLEDLERGKGKLAIRQTDLSAFEVGRDLALTPGKVIYRNELFELLQYTPTTQTVYERPLLIFPPWINKFYILDLTEQKSFVRWAVAQGLTVFVVSWVNPDSRLAKFDFNNYLKTGVLAALDAVEEACGAKEVNAIGYCIGGTMLGSSLAYMAKVEDRRITAATFFAAQMDFTDAGDLSVFVDDAQLDTLKAQMTAAGGVLPSSAMAQTFNMLRSNDLVWSYVVNNYLLGRDPFPFDLLFWNADQTRMPSALHLAYLTDFYRDNLLARGRLQLGGETLDLGKVKIPIYLQSSREDHIAPCKSVFNARTLFGGKTKFIVAGSGHIAGVINPPGANKYQYWTNDKPAKSLDEWWPDATEHPGSWWVDWIEWIKPLSGAQVPARIPGEGKLTPLGDAPGTYVKIKSE